MSDRKNDEASDADNQIDAAWKLWLVTRCHQMSPKVFEEIRARVIRQVSMCPQETSGFLLGCMALGNVYYVKSQSGVHLLHNLADVKDKMLRTAGGEDDNEE